MWTLRPKAVSAAAARARRATDGDGSGILPGSRLPSGRPLTAFPAGKGAAPSCGWERRGGPSPVEAGPRRCSAPRTRRDAQFCSGKYFKKTNPKPTSQLRCVEMIIGSRCKNCFYFFMCCSSGSQQAWGKGGLFIIPFYFYPALPS